MRHKKFFPYVLIAPFVIFFAVFRLYPIVLTFLRSVTESNSGVLVYRGFSNYANLIQDRLLLQVLVNTAVVFMLYVAIKMPLLMVISIVIREMKKNKALYIRTLYLPTLVGGFAYGIIYRYLFTYNGIVNHVLNFTLGIRVDWLGEAFFARYVIVFALLWGSLGIHVLMLVNALNNVSSEQLEYGALEGATFIDRMRYIFIPHAKPLLKVIVFISLIETIGMIDVPLNLTNGGPYQSTMTLGLYVYKQAFQYGDFAYAGTIGVLILFLSIAFLVLFGRKEALYENYY
jgi:lactose/L-arabinose transport system permease protein